jgi:two-component system, OmpR family, response regulator RegX3
LRVLLVEDDDTIAEPLVDGLARYGFTVDRVRTGTEALHAPAPETVLLDLGLPDIDGIDVCRRFRLVSEVPIIMLTARGAEADRVVGLEMGADDYLTKPFGVRELIARIRAVHRRTRHAVKAQAASPAGLAINRRTRQVELDGRGIDLARKEFDLLTVLAEDSGAVVTRRQILDAVWGPHFFGPGKTLDVHVASLRHKLGDPGWIETRRGVGFRLAVPVVMQP